MEIEELEKPLALFSILKEKDRRGDLPSWSDIWIGLNFYWDRKVPQIKKTNYFYNDFDIKILEELGVDYNFRDYSGNNFFQYIMGVRNSGRNDNKKEPVVWGNALDYVIGKTKDIYSPNNYGRNVLNDMMTYSGAGSNGEDFFNFIKKYPNFDLNLIDKSGRNLMFEAIMNPAPFAVIDYLLENNVSLSLVDKDGYNLLHLFIFNGNTKQMNKYFNVAFESLDNIAKKTKFNESFFELCVKLVVDDKVHVENNKKFRFWINKSFNKIINGEFKIKREVLVDLMDIFNQIEKPYSMRSSEEEVALFTATKNAIQYYMIDTDIIKNQDTSLKKIKI
jgi:ankyrin repeat protein